MMRRWFLFFTTLIAPLTQASQMPKELYLMFEDKTLSLHFQAQPELLSSNPKHFLSLGNLKIPVDFDGQLPENNKFFTIETKFSTGTSLNRIAEFFEAGSILRPEKKAPVEVRLDEKGEEVVFEGMPSQGFDIDQERLVGMINYALRTGKTHIRVPAKKVYSKVVVHPELKDRGIEEIIAFGQSNFTGSSEARKQNILAAANKFNGLVIPRGKYFSFNRVLESVREEDGFVKELVIKGNETEKELGGGVCQVSTTAFRAAFEGGLPITQRRNHSYAVPYYKPYGLDATIYLGAQDLVFKNNTPGDILVQTFLEEDDLSFVFYGKSDGRMVITEGPFITEHQSAPAPIVYESEDLPFGEIETLSASHDGFQTQWKRHITWESGYTYSDEFNSNYRAWPARVKKGTKKIAELEEARELGG